jgi:TRAP transporter 4TM/12TM fusion protein
LGALVTIAPSGDVEDGFVGRRPRLEGRRGQVLTAFAVLFALVHIYAAIAGAPPFGFLPIVTYDVLRYLHAGGALLLVFALFPSRRLTGVIDTLLIVLVIGCVGYVLFDLRTFLGRAAAPNVTDLIAGSAFVVLILEATRRATGPVIPVIAVALMAYALFGRMLPMPLTIRGYSFERLIGHLFVSAEGIFSIPLYVSATMIVMFSIYGSILKWSGAGTFFIDFSMALMRRGRNGSARAVLLASFLLGGPSGSGVATTIMLASVSYPVLKNAGMSKDSAGGLLAAGGLGAVLSPPVLGSAAFLLAQYLQLSYLTVILMSVVPCLLYYFSVLLMVEVEPRPQSVTTPSEQSAWTVLKSGWHHFISVFAVVVFLIAGYSPGLSAFWASVVAIALSFVDRPNALQPRRLYRALADGITGTLAVAVTCAVAGLIVGVVTLTGLGLKFATLIEVVGGGNLLFAALLAAVVVWTLGLAIPISASYIICSALLAPIFVKLGVPVIAAHMFVFYYAILSDVSPPTALSPMAAATITGGDPLQTTLQTWKYTLPSFIVPFVFVLDPAGVGLLMQVPEGSSWLTVIEVCLRTAAGITAFVVGGRYLYQAPRRFVAGGLLVLGGIVLLFPGSLAFAMNTAIASLVALAISIAGVVVLSLPPRSIDVRR